MAEAQGVLLKRNGRTGRPVTEDVPVTSILGFHHGEVLVYGPDQQLMDATRGLRDHFRSVTQVTEEIGQAAQSRQHIRRASQNGRTDPTVRRSTGRQQFGLLTQAGEPFFASRQRGARQCLDRIADGVRSQRTGREPDRTAAPGFQPGNGSPGRGEGDPVVAVHRSFRKGELVIGHDRVCSHILRFHVLAGKWPAEIFHWQVNVRVDDANRGPALGLLLPEDPLESFDARAELGGRFHALSCSCSAGLSVRPAGVKSLRSLWLTSLPVARGVHQV